MSRHTFISWNVNGIRAAERKGFLDWLAQSNADLVAVQETKASEAQLSAQLRHPSDYYVEWCAAERAGYSGVATFSRQPPLATTRGIGDPRYDCEGRVLVSHFADLSFYNIYFPSGSSGMARVTYKLAFYARLLEVLAEHLAAGERMIVAGDVNTAYAPLDLARPRENTHTSGFMPAEREALGRFFAAGLLDTFRYMHPTEAKYSWWSLNSNARARNVGWRLDYLLVSPNLREQIVAADILCGVPGSDHCPVTLTLEL